MNENKLSAYYREFPWLSKFCEIKNAGKVSVQRIDHKLLKKIPDRPDFLEQFIVASFGDLFDMENSSEEIFLLNSSGESLARVGEIQHDPKPKKWWRKNPRPYTSHSSRETVGEALTRLDAKLQEAVHFIAVMEIWELSKTNIVIYKIPKGWTLQQWIEEEIQREQKKIQEEKLQIDTV